MPVCNKVLFRFLIFGLAHLMSFSFGSFSAFGQSTIGRDKNPFELPHRTEELSENHAKRDSVVTETDLLPSKKHIRRSILNKYPYARWYVPSLLLLLAVIVSFYRKGITALFRSLFSLSYLNYLQRDSQLRSSLQNKMLSILLLLSTPFYLQQLADYFLVMYIPWWKLAIFVLSIFVSRFLILQLVNYAFDDNLEFGQFRYTIFVFSLLSGILLVPINAIIAFGQQSLAEFTLYTSLLFFVLLYLYRLFRGVILFGRQLLANKLRIITYLCSLEIAPILLFYKILLQLGV